MTSTKKRIKINSMPVTMKDIAKKCKVSFSTVSKALKNSPEIGIETINLVKETAKEMGYQPNLAARVLRTNRTFDIGVVFEDATGSGLQHQYFAEIFDSVNVEANKKGYCITFLNSQRKTISYLEQAKSRHFDGIILVSTDFSRDDVQELLKSKIPVSMLDYDGDFPNACSVLSDNYDGMKSLVDFIISKGHRKIAFIHGENTEVTIKRIEAYKAALKEAKIPFNEDYLVEGQFHGTKASEEATEKLFALSERPTCIIYPDDFAYLGGQRALLSHNLVPGKDISTAGYDGILLSSLLTPPLTTYSQDAKKLGTELFDSLVDIIEGKKDGKSKPVKIAGKLFEGESVIKI